MSRPCGRCGEVVDYCGSCQPGRRYCGGKCSEEAREESVREAHAKYNDRASPEGREVHRLEEKGRRERQAKAREAVGDQRFPEKAGEVEVPALVTPLVAMEARDARLEPVAAMPFPAVVDAAEPVATMPFPAVVDAAEPVAAMPFPAVVNAAEPVEWILVAWPEVLASARRRLGTEASCPFCGRRGRIVRVVSLYEWQQWIRRGIDPPT